jgi:integrase
MYSAVPSSRVAGQTMVEISPRDVRGYVDQLELLGQAASSVRKNFAPVRALLATAVEDGLLAANPAGVIWVVGTRGGGLGADARRALTRDELQAFMAGLPQEWVPFFQLLARLPCSCGQPSRLEPPD